MFGGLFRPGGDAPDLGSVVLVCAALATMVLTDVAQRKLGSFEGVWRIPAGLRAVAYSVMIVGVLVWSGGTARPFIYFQF